MRKGISFTLTIIIVAVVLMAGALTLVAMFGAGIGDFFGAITETSTEARVRSDCNRVINNIDNRVCSMTYDESQEEINGFDDVSEEDHLTRVPPLSDAETCNQNNCNWENILGNDFAEVEVDGDVYDCQEMGYISGNTCPVGDVQP